MNSCISDEVGKGNKKSLLASVALLVATQCPLSRLCVWLFPIFPSSFFQCV